MATDVVNRQRLSRIDADRVARVADATLAAVARDGADLSVAFVRDRVMRELNNKFRGIDRTTDVLSFPAEEERESFGAVPSEEKRESFGAVPAKEERESFGAVPAEKERESFGAVPLIGGGLPEHVGDIVISTDTAMRQASEAGHSFAHEVDELVIHGVLHLCGYDHETDGGLMNRLELKLRKKLLSET